MRRDDGGGDPVVVAQFAHCERETEKAIYVELDDESYRWFPKSVIHDDSEVFDAGKNADGKFVVKRWFVEKDEPDPERAERQRRMDAATRRGIGEERLAGDLEELDGRLPWPKR